MVSHQTFSGHLWHLTGQIKFDQTNLLYIINEEVNKFPMGKQMSGQFSNLIVSTEYYHCNPIYTKYYIVARVHNDNDSRNLYEIHGVPTLHAFKAKDPLQKLSAGQPTPSLLLTVSLLSTYSGIPGNFCMQCLQCLHLYNVLSAVFLVTTVSTVSIMSGVRLS